MPAWIQLQSTRPSQAPGPTVPRILGPPELDEGPHFSYAVQWFIFSVCVAIGWVLAVRRSVAARRRNDGAQPASADDPA